MDFVQLYWKRNRSWPRPEDSWGLDSLYGPTGWCHTCGTPKHEQTGQLHLAAEGMAPPLGAWVPNWLFDTLCVGIDDSVSAQIEGFSVELRDVVWVGSSPGATKQVVVPTVGKRWFDEEELRRRVVERHGAPGTLCPACGTWRWMPLTFGLLPPLKLDFSAVESDTVASPEWFGDGKQSYRQVLVRRELAEFLAAASPKDFKIRAVQ